MGVSSRFGGLWRSAVGASLLAMVVNDNAGSLTPRGVLRFIASKLAPTQKINPQDRIKVASEWR
ncbi:hypothetical protein BZ163_09345 [Pseudomonas sp. VI4.1]|nr:hypothetical protein BZ163_09345 [Pseudomonas sp. VI4.1]